MNVSLILGLIQAAAMALQSPGITTARVQAIAGLVNLGTGLVSAATLAGNNFTTAMQKLTAQVNALHTEGRDDLTDSEQDALDTAIRSAHAEIQASATAADPLPPGSTGI
jgi:hypothetical protein